MAADDAPLPRITIQFCTQCKWMLRAAYYAQELLSTFSLALGEVALQPATGGTFVVAITSGSPPAPRVLWDRRVDGGFPDVKELKRRVRDVVDPARDLGHVDRHPAAPPVRPEPAPELTLRGRGNGGDEHQGERADEHKEGTQGMAAAARAGSCEDCA